MPSGTRKKSTDEVADAEWLEAQPKRKPKPPPIDLHKTVADHIADISKLVAELDTIERNKRRDALNAAMQTMPTTIEDDDDFPTTRRWPRTLGDAFPDEQTPVIEPPPRTLMKRAIEAFWWAASGLAVVAMLTSPLWWPK